MGTSDLHNDGCRSVWGLLDPVKAGVQCMWMESSGELENLIVQDQHRHFFLRLAICSVATGLHGKRLCGTFDLQNTYALGNVQLPELWWIREGWE
ncbi:uncharacterized protein BO96DRAFT_93593 [Aspergillus niger CBS 101883]|nr:uncharacterized protein BO96DRAFT_93593 [Aspergillus niger CBS 101883]PYH61244.1 hypothetical protein BO96DRAFT_93593 [Aspergillus niger CBS 101883]